MKKFLSILLVVFMVYMVWSFVDVNNHNLPSQSGEISKYNAFQIMVNNMNE